MKIRKNEILVFVLVLVTFVAAFLIYPSLPNKIASHWGIDNEVNGYMGKFWGVFLLPIMMFGFAILFMVIPRIDPKRQNIEKFEKYFDNFVLGFMFFFMYIYALTIFWNLGYRFILIQFMAPAFAVLFYLIGTMIKYAEPNWSIGIRTPWTLSNEDVWYKTHKLGGKLFQIVAAVSLLGMILPQYAIYFVVVPIILVAIYLVVYSYLEFRKKTT
ncbi:MAG: SdpI family protein [bacterium]